MNLRPIVKLMNFHALMRVDNSRKLAERQKNLEASLTDMMDIVMNNRNFILDKTLMSSDPTKPPLYIYIGSDFGFCGALNHRVEDVMKRNVGALKIVIGRRLNTVDIPGVVFQCDRAECDKDDREIRRIILTALRTRQYSSIVLVYNQYKNASNSALVCQEVFPMTRDALDSRERTDRRYKDDFVVEGDATELLAEMLCTYVEFEMSIALNSSFASENSMRQEVTDKSLEKLDEIEEQNRIDRATERRTKEFNSVIETYSRLSQNY